MKNDMLSAEEIEQFKNLFSKFCQGEINAGRCGGDTCEWCPINKAYEEIFDSLEEDEECEDEDDEEDCEENNCEAGTYDCDTCSNNGDCIRQIEEG